MKNKYTIEYFLRDPEFIRWVRNPDHGSSEFWHSFAEQHPESKQEMTKAAELIRTVKINRNFPEEEFRQDVLNNIVARISASALNRSRRVRHRIIKTLWQYAAVLLITIGTMYAVFHLLYTQERGTPQSQVVPPNFVKESPLGTKIQTKLPDGTSVWINSGSRLEYFEDTLQNSRNVVLDGEAFFEVVKNPAQPFIVKTRGISVKALGTSFNVRAYRDRLNLEVSLLTGKVVVSSLENTLSTLELLPGEKAVIDDDKSRGFTKQTFDYIRDFGWMEGILSFSNADFGIVKEELERWYGVKIFVSDEGIFRGWTVDGQFEDQSLEMVLTHLSYTKDFDFKITGKEVYLKKKN